MKRLVGILAGVGAALALVSPALAASISGVVFKDANSNGVQDTGEIGIGPVVVYIDANNNDLRDTGELTAATDGDTGAYAFTGVAAGTYTVRIQVTPTLDGMVATIPASMEQSVTVTEDQTLAGVNFGFKPAAATNEETGELPVTGQTWPLLLGTALPITLGLWLMRKAFVKA